MESDIGRDMAETLQTSAFDSHYLAIWGPRWWAIRESFSSRARPKVNLSEHLGGLKGTYELDPSSVVPVLQLQPAFGDRFLDVCSAPGGKGLGFIAMASGVGEFVLNELSPARRGRLKSVVAAALEGSTREATQIWAENGERLGLKFRNRPEKEKFSKILVDAPCSGERYQLENPRQMLDWKPKSSKLLSIRQHSLLCSALDCLRAGGLLVYSTCTVSRWENEDVIERFLSKRGGRATVRPLRSLASGGFQLTPGKSDLGAYILPDDNDGCGPVYFCALVGSN